MEESGMLAAVLESQNPNRFAVKRVPVPAIGEDDVLVKVARCGICMTDVHAFEGRMFIRTPITLAMSLLALL